MKCFCCSFVLNILVLSIYGQVSKIDSLQDLISSAHKDAQKQELYIQKLKEEIIQFDYPGALSSARKAYSFSGSNDEKASALRWAGEALVALNELDQTTLLLDSIYALTNSPDILIPSKLIESTMLANKGQIDSALACSNQALYLAKENKVHDFNVAVYNSVGIRYCMLGMLAQCDSFLTIAVHEAEHASALDKLKNISYNLGMLNDSQGKYAAAARWYVKSLEASTTLKDYQMMSGCQAKLGTIACFNFEEKKGDELFEKSLMTIKEHQLHSMVSVDAFMQAVVQYQKQGKAEKVLEESTHMLKISEAIQSDLAIHISKVLMANGYCGLNMLDSCEIQIKDVMSFIQGKDDDPRLFNIYSFLMDPLIKLKKFKTAQKFLPSFKEYAFSLDDIGLENEYYNYAYEIHKHNGNDKLALVSLESSYQARDTFLQNMAEQRLLNTRIAYETEQKELENKELLNRNSLVANRNKILWGSIAILSLLCSLLAWLYLKNQKARKTIQEQNQKLQELNSTKDRLFSIISHDLRNEVSAFQNLNNIFSFHLEKGNYERLAELSKQVDKSALTVNTLMDNLLQWASSQLHGIKLDIQKLSLEKQTKDVIDIFEEFSKTKGISINVSNLEGKEIYADEQSVQFIVRNIISNAVKFSESGDEIEISAEESSDGIAIKILDTGVGIPSPILENIWLPQNKSSLPGTRGERGAGIGLSLVKDFVHKNKGQIHIESEEGRGTLVTLILPKAI